MNCTDARDRLPGLLYGDLPAAENTAVEGHLAGCPACRQEYAVLQRLPSLLDAAPAPAAAVDLPRLYEQVAHSRERQLRRWRSAAIALGAAAVLLLAVAGLRLELRLEAHQVTLRWGAPGDISAPPAVPVVSRPDAPVAAEDVQLVKDLIHALADDVEARDQRQQQAVAFLQTGLTELWVQVQQRWSAAPRQVAARSAPFVPSRKE